MLTNPANAARSGLRTAASTRTEDAAQLGELLVRTSRRLHRSVMAELGPMGLTGAQARVIRYLEAMGQPVRMADIAAALEVVPRTATSIVDGLEAARLVLRAIDPNDRRSILVSFTDEGALVLDRLAKARRRTAEAIFSPLSPTERAELLRLLTTLCGPCAGQPGHCAPGGRGLGHHHTTRDR
jgi:DNA-binding MarR family transcriptional regulator